MKPMLHVGAYVWWESQSSGTWAKKEGQIIARVPGTNDGGMLDRLSAFIPEEWQVATKIMFDGFQRPEDCYIVAVGSKSGSGKMRLYCPRVSALRRVVL